MRTKEDYTLEFRDYGEITVPAGTRVTNQTACGPDISYHFVCQHSWISRDYPSVARMLHHDVFYYGINVPVELIEYGTPSGKMEVVITRGEHIGKVCLVEEVTKEFGQRKYRLSHKGEHLCNGQSTYFTKCFLKLKSC